MPAGAVKWMSLAAAVAAALALTSAHADVYTWVDARGNTNISNLAPPPGTRVVSVTHEDPAAKARADAARDAAQQAQIRALSERVADLEKRAEAPIPPPPVVYAPPPALPAPPPRVNVVVMPSTYGSDVTPDYGCAWVGCALPFGYPIVFFGTTSRFHHDRPFKRFESVHSPGFGKPMHPPGRPGRG